MRDSTVALALAATHSIRAMGPTPPSIAEFFEKKKTLGFR
jgi:hypothetical protein